MSERDELARTIEDVDIANEWDPSPGMYLKYGDAILAAGYRKPRTITTAEELDALPLYSAVVDDEGVTWVHQVDGWRNVDDRQAEDGQTILWATTSGPIITVLWEPSA